MTAFRVSPESQWANLVKPKCSGEVFQLEPSSLREPEITRTRFELDSDGAVKLSGSRKEEGSS